MNLDFLSPKIIVPFNCLIVSIAVGFTGHEITVVTALGCPGPIAFITEFFKLIDGWHAPRAAPVLTGCVVTAGRADARLTANLVDAPTAF